MEVEAQDVIEVLRERLNDEIYKNALLTATIRKLERATSQ